MDNKKTKVLNLIFLIIILILLACIACLVLSDQNTESLKPSGNVNIFDINCNYNCECDENSRPAFSEEDFKENINAFDKNMTWDSVNELNIFANPMYEMKNKIAPESTNFYQFVIRNTTIYDVRYNVKFDELNLDKINMKYRLLKNDIYMAGSEDLWVTYDGLNIENLLLKSNSSDTYYLEWKWFSGPNDSEIGEKGNANYSLKIDIKAVQEQ